TLPIHTIGPQTHVLVSFFPFGCILDPERFSNERSLDLEPFRDCMKLCAKRAKLVQLMQKFVPRCLVRNFCNDRSRSTPLDPKLMFWCIFFRSGAFSNSFATARNLVQNAPNWCNLCKSSCNDVLLEFFCNECSRSTPLEPKLMFWCVSFRLGAFGTVSLLHKTCCKTRQTGP